MTDDLLAELQAIEQLSERLMLAIARLNRRLEASHERKRPASRDDDDDEGD